MFLTHTGAVRSAYKVLFMMLLWTARAIVRSACREHVRIEVEVLKCALLSLLPTGEISPYAVWENVDVQVVWENVDVQVAFAHAMDSLLIYLRLTSIDKRWICCVMLRKKNKNV
ncbi:unnamed protein product [Ectocarpus sp. 12 AP-2014]